MFVAHTREDKIIQTVKEHSESTAKMAEEFSILDLKDMIYNIGLLHDIGKYQNSFQKKILKDTKIKISHAVCGAKEIENIYGKNHIIKIMEYCIAGHHSGIPDGGVISDKNAPEELKSLYAVLARDCEVYEEYKNDLKPKKLNFKELETFLKDGCSNMQEITEKFAFITRYCFSCLTDADSIDTSEFCTNEKTPIIYSDFKECLNRLDDLFKSFIPKTQLQKARSNLQTQVFEKINTNHNIYLMNMPTGSGKTLCSLKFALEKAVREDKRRIIYVIPYNSIIDQTANVFEKAFGDSLNILRHQSSFSYEEQVDLDEDYKKWALKSIENWSGDFIITTAVQFFESIYGNKRGKLRKLHNMADAILIFDEAHLMPLNYLEPCLKGIIHITKFLNSNAIFLTATMPDFNKILMEYTNDDLSILDLVEDKKDFSKFSRCEYLFKEFYDIESFVQSENDCISRLIITNSKKSARKIFDLCTGKKYHLSTYMTGKDRSRVIENIRENLKELDELENVPEDKRITVVSTSLIEAGVDLDFHIVYRELSGLDHVLQSGGRCNREGKRDNAKTIVFSFESNCKLNVEQALIKGIINEFEDISSEESIKTYYERLFNDKKNEINQFSIYEKGQKFFQIPFRSYAEKFNIISDNNMSVVIPQDDFSKEILYKLKNTRYINSRLIQNYTVTVTKNEFNDLLKLGVIDDFDSGVFFLNNLDYYDENLGIKFVGNDYFI